MTQFKQQYYTTEYAERNRKLRNYWRTPDYIFNPLHEVFHFTIDAAANKDNAKLDRFFSESDNGLEQSWDGEIVFCNPPHSHGAYGEWVDKAETEFLNSGTTSVLILPFNWETKGFKPARKTARYLILPHKRIKYDKPTDEFDNISPTFYSGIAVFTWFTLHEKDLDTLSSIGMVIDLEIGMIGGR
jgi:phage N-6-adenine-methyltransferase